jgi:hypothetical protein
MKSIAIRLSLSLIGLIAVTAPRGADAATLATRLNPPAIHAGHSGQAADPSIIGGAAPSIIG